MSIEKEDYDSIRIGDIITAKIENSNLLYCVAEWVVVDIDKKDSLYRILAQPCIFLDDRLKDCGLFTMPEYLTIKNKHIGNYYKWLRRDNILNVNEINNFWRMGED